MERQNPNAVTPRQDGEDAAGLQKVIELPQSADHNQAGGADGNILQPGLNDAGASGPGEGQDGSKVKVVRKNPVPVPRGNLEELGIGGLHGSEGAPVGRHEAVLTEEARPLRGEAGVHQDFHAACRSTSNDSAKWAAWERAAATSSFSR